MVLISVHMLSGILSGILVAFKEFKDENMDEFGPGE